MSVAVTLLLRRLILVNRQHLLLYHLHFLSIDTQLWALLDQAVHVIYVELFGHLLDPFAQNSVFQFQSRTIAYIRIPLMPMSIQRNML